MDSTSEHIDPMLDSARLRAVGKVPGSAVDTPTDPPLQGAEHGQRGRASVATVSALSPQTPGGPLVADAEELILGEVVAAYPAVNNLGIVSTTTLQTRTWPADLAHLGEIRFHTRGWLARLGLDPMVVADVVLAVNEAASNAMEHAYDGAAAGTVEVVFAVNARAVCVDIIDHGRWQTRLSDTGRGHGLPIMRGVIESVSIQHDRPGTRVRLHQTRT